MSRSRSILRMPLMWGGLAYLIFYALIDQGVLADPFTRRYFASHPVEYITTALSAMPSSALQPRVSRRWQLKRLDWRSNIQDLTE